MTATTEQLALVHRPVLEGQARAVYVARRTETIWLVGGPDFTDAEPSQFRQIRFAGLVELDSSLADLGDLPVGRCASRSDRARCWSYGVIPIGSTFLVTYDTRPDESNPKRRNVGGAIANCWIVAETFDAAVHRARDHLSETGWVIVERVDANHARAEAFDHDPYFRQAQIDGMVVVFHSYPDDELELD